jgi:hypothetical protein
VRHEAVVKALFLNTEKKAVVSCAPGRLRCGCHEPVAVQGRAVRVKGRASGSARAPDAGLTALAVRRVEMPGF